MTAVLLPAGSTVSRYRIVSRIGAGGMGEVYKAHDPELDRPIALKILPFDLVRQRRGSADHAASGAYVLEIGASSI